MATINGRVVCSPRRMRLPARTDLVFSVINRSPGTLRFSAPEFLRAAGVTRTSHPWIDVDAGSFIVRPRGAARLTLRSPWSGEFYYACNRPGQQPRLASTGFIIVLPSARR